MSHFSKSRHQQMMPIEHDMHHMWQLAADRCGVRLSLPGLPVAGLAEPVRVNIDFDTSAVDQIIERLTVLRAHMKPGLPPAGTQN